MSSYNSIETAFQFDVTVTVGDEISVEFQLTIIRTLIQGFFSVPTANAFVMASFFPTRTIEISMQIDALL